MQLSPRGNNKVPCARAPPRYVRDVPRETDHPQHDNRKSRINGRIMNYGRPNGRSGYRAVAASRGARCIREL